MLRAATPPSAVINFRLPMPIAICPVPMVMPAAMWEEYHASKWGSVALIGPLADDCRGSFWGYFGHHLAPKRARQFLTDTVEKGVALIGEQ